MNVPTISIAVSQWTFVQQSGYCHIKNPSNRIPIRSYCLSKYLKIFLVFKHLSTLKVELFLDDIYSEKKWKQQSQRLLNGGLHQMATNEQKKVNNKKKLNYKLGMVFLFIIIAEHFSWWHKFMNKTHI